MAESKAPGSRWAKRLGRRLAEVERVRGLTQERFAEEIGVTKSSLSGWLRGVSVPRGDNLAKIADKFDVSVDWLLTGKDHEGKDSSGVVFRGQIRSVPELESDLAEYIAREVGDLEGKVRVGSSSIPLPVGVTALTTSLRGTPSPQDFTIHTSRMLREMVDHVREEMIAYRNWYWMDYNRAMTAVALAELAINAVPVRPSTSHRNAHSVAALNLLPPMIVGLCVGPPPRRYVAPKREAFGGTLPEEQREVARTEHARARISGTRSPADRIARIEVNGVEVYRERKR